MKKIKRWLPVSLCKKLSKETFKDVERVWTRRGDISGWCIEKREKAMRRKFVSSVLYYKYPCPIFEELLAVVLSKPGIEFSLSNDPLGFVVTLKDNNDWLMCKSCGVGKTPIEALCRAYLEAVEEGLFDDKWR